MLGCTIECVASIERTYGDVRPCGVRAPRWNCSSGAGFLPEHSECVLRLDPIRTLTELRDVRHGSVHPRVTPRTHGRQVGERCSRVLIRARCETRECLDE